MSFAKDALGLVTGGLKTAGEVVGVGGTVGIALTVGEVVAHRTGLLPKDKSLLREGLNTVLDFAGAPDATKRGAAASAPKQLGAGTEPAASAEDARAVCPVCHTDQPIELAGEPAARIILVPCEEHATEVLHISGHHEAMYSAWASSFGLGAAGMCGAMPKKDKFTTSLLGQKVFNQHTYEKALIAWQKCKMEEAASKAKTQAEVDKVKADAEQKAQAAVDAQRKKDAVTAGFKLSTQRKKYEKQIADMEAQQKAAKDEAEKAAIQEQINQLKAAKDQSDILAAQLKEQAKDAEHAAQLAALTAKVNDAGSKSGGLDDLVKLMIMKQLGLQDPQTQQPVPPPWYPAQEFQAQVAQQPYQQPYEVVADEWGFEYAGASDPLGADIASEFGLADGATVGDGEAFVDLVQDGFDPAEVASYLNDSRGSLSGCATGTCAIAR